jgi:chromosome segregation ATPase
MNDVRKIKQLQSQISILTADVEVLKIDISNKQKEQHQKLQTIANLKKAIEAMNDSEVKVSEHAILRYLERVEGLDVSRVEKEILTDEVLKMVETLGGNGKYPLKGFQLVMKDFTVTTIV